jgi:glycosyltransferase involved in cell wall biosynthesis
MYPVLTEDCASHLRITIHVKLGIVIPEFQKQGGTERCIASLAEALSRRGHNLVIFSHRRNPTIVPEAHWRRVPMLERPHILRFFSFFLANPVLRMLAAGRGERIDALLSTGPDVLHPDVTAFHCCATTVAENLNCEPRKNGDSGRFRRWANLVTYRLVALLESYVVRRGARKVVAVSWALKCDLLDACNVPEARLSVIHDGVDIDTFQPCSREQRVEMRTILGLPSDAKIVLFVGHNWERKGLERLVDALILVCRSPMLLHPFLLVVGGTRAEAVQTYARQHLIGQVKFLGMRDDLDRIYPAADVLVLPSILESFGLPVLEAMACGIPAVVSRSAGVAELITDGVDGVLLDDPTDPQELAAKLKLLLDDPSLRLRIGEAARRTAEKHSWDLIAEQFEKILFDAGSNG